MQELFDENMQRRISTDDVVEVLRERDPDEHPVVTTSYLAEETDVTRPTALRRLDDAHEEGLVKKSEIGQAAVYWLNNDPITLERAKSVIDSEAGDDEPAPEVVTDGAVGGNLEGLNDLLQSNREMIHETRALRKQRQNLSRNINRAGVGLLLAMFGVAVAFLQLYLPIPPAVQSVAGLCILGGLVYAVFVIAKAVGIEEPEADTPEPDSVDEAPE